MTSKEREAILNLPLCKSDIEWMLQVLTKKYEKPTTLYAIHDLANDRIIFNARGGCYKYLEAAQKKLDKLVVTKGYSVSQLRIVTYELVE